MPGLLFSLKIAIFSMFALRVFLNDYVDRRRKVHVAAHVVAVRMGVDQRRDRLRRQLLDLVENRPPPARVFRVDHGHAVGHHEDGGVAAAAAQHPEVVLDLLDLDDFRRVRRRLRLHRRQPPDASSTPST